jgi:hypothetical protein
MIKRKELSENMRGLLDTLSPSEAQDVLEMATEVMFQVENRPGQARLGENGAVELVLRLVVLANCPDKAE